jgi:hypothetical protein
MDQKNLAAVWVIIPPRCWIYFRLAGEETASTHATLTIANKLVVGCGTPDAAKLHRRWHQFSFSHTIFWRFFHAFDVFASPISTYRCFHTFCFHVSVWSRSCV